MTEKRNPAASANRVRSIANLAKGDASDLTENPSDFQSEILVARQLARRFGIGLHHALVVCELAGIGRAA